MLLTGRYPYAPSGRRSCTSRSPFILHPSSFILHPSSFILHPSSFILHPSSFILHPSSFILHPSSFILHPSSFILHPSISHLTFISAQRACRCAPPTSIPQIIEGAL